jgi:tetratricopeptide (TPR) repeat protein
VNWRQRLVALDPAWWVALTTFVVFLPSLWAGLIWDDRLLVEHNEQIRSLANLPDVFRSHFWVVAGDAGEDPLGLQQQSIRRYYRPLVTVSYMLNWAVAGSAAWLYHLTNVLLHACTAALVTRVSTRWCDSRTGGLVAGLLFALHPTRTEAVVWVAGRTDVLMALLMLGATEVAFASGRRGGRAKLLYGAAAVALGALATLAKEPAIALPLLLLVEPLRSETRSAALRRAAPLLSATAAYTVAYVVVRLVWFPVEVGRGSTSTSLSYPLVTLASYVERLVWPWPQSFFVHLVEFDGTTPIYPLGYVVAGGLMALLIAVWFAWCLRHDRPSASLLAATGVMIGPLLNVVPTELPHVTQDRFLYLPLWSFSLAAVRLVLRLAATRGGWQAAPRRPMLLAGLGLALVAAGVIETRTIDFVDPERFWARELELRPDNPTALTIVAARHEEQGRTEQAYVLYRRALDPSAQRFRMLARRPPTAFLETHGHAAALMASLTADGAAKELRLMLSQLRAMLDAAATPLPGKVADLPLGVGYPDRLVRATLPGFRSRALVDALLIASRIGDEEAASALLDDAALEAFAQSPNAPNASLALARFGRFELAKRHLEILTRQPGRDAQAIANLEARIARAQRLLARAEQSSALEAAMLRAQGQAEIGGYLLGLEALAPWVEGTGIDGTGIEATGGKAVDAAAARQLVPLYVQLLVAARLDDRALEVATEPLGKERALGVIQQIRSQLPERVRRLRPVGSDVAGHPGWRRDG